MSKNYWVGGYPTKPGWYWFKERDVPGEEWEIVHIIEENDVLCWDSNFLESPIPIPVPAAHCFSLWSEALVPPSA